MLSQIPLQFGVPQSRVSDPFKIGIVVIYALKKTASFQKVAMWWCFLCSPGDQNVVERQVKMVSVCGVLPKGMHAWHPLHLWWTQTENGIEEQYFYSAQVPSTEKQLEVFHACHFICFKVGYL